MNIIEAIKSGKKFRRKGEKSWYSAISDNYPLINISAISRENFLAEDWEIEHQPVTITREQLVEAYRNALARATNLDSYKRIDHVNAMAEELGL